MESTPLLASSSSTAPPSSSSSGLDGGSHRRTNSNSYYFLNKQQDTYQGIGTTGSVRDNDGGNVVEELPAGAVEEEFAPRPLGPRKPSIPRQVTGPPANGSGGGGTSGGGAAGGGGGSVWSRWFGFGGSAGPSSGSQRPYGEVGTLLKLRKAPVKIEPKVFFANERTFLAWMHLSVILAGASIAILAFAEDQNPMSQLYGVLMLPVAIAFIAYSMYQYARRASMIRHRHPGPYEDTIGPAVLGVMLMSSILAQFAIKLYAMRFG